VLFTIDIGNTNIVGGVFDARSLKKTWRLTTHRDWTVNEMAALLRGFFNQDKIARSKIEGIAVSSVVPSLVPVFEECCVRLFRRKPLIIDHTLKLGIKVKTDKPSEVGADRLVNAAQAWHQVKRAVLILDMGTAITVDAVNQHGEYVGGAIAPGITVALDALVHRAAQLPRVDLEKPVSPLGANTTDSIRAGIYYGTVGQVGELLKQCAAGLGGKPVIFATGGWASWVPLQQLGVKVVDPDLTLKGLKTLYQKNRAPRRRNSRNKAS
jgi:type III pantothenate kinase